MQNAIIVTNGHIIFNEREVMLEQAKQFSMLVKSIEVTEENIQKAKKGAAEIKKRINAVEDERKRVKREILAPYDVFESQVKEITSIMNEADDHIRIQVKEFEEKKREEKRRQIEKIFDLRMVHYRFNFMNFEHFFKKEFLNQSMSIDKVESEMVKWFESTKKELETIQRMDNSSEILSEYVKYQDLSSAISVVQMRQKDIEEIESVEKERNGSKVKDEPKEKVLRIKFKNEKDANLAILVLENSGLEFKLL